MNLIYVLLNFVFVFIMTIVWLDKIFTNRTMTSDQVIGGTIIMVVLTSIPMFAQFVLINLIK